MTFFDIIKNYEEPFYQKIYQEYQMRLEEMNNENNEIMEEENNGADFLVPETENGPNFEREGEYHEELDHNFVDGENALFNGTEMEFIDS